MTPTEIAISDIRAWISTERPVAFLTRCRYEIFQIFRVWILFAAVLATSLVLLIGMTTTFDVRHGGPAGCSPIGSACALTDPAL